MEVFGSYLTKKEKLGDLDIAVELKFRYPDEKGFASPRQKKLMDERIKLADLAERRFPNFLSRIYWPHEEVAKFLKGRSTGLSFTDTDDLDLLSKHFPETRRRVIFQRAK